MGFFSKIKEGLSKTRSQIAEKAKEVIKVFSKIDDELFDELEETLIEADVGYETSANIIQQLRQKAKTDRITDGDRLQDALKQIVVDIMTANDVYVSDEPPRGTMTVYLIIGVNGVGKTTSIGKLAAHFKSQNKKVLLAAGDTFRAAAIDQLCVWADRAGCDVIKQSEGSDPAAVIYDAIMAAKARKVDVLICDTAGRLHTKSNLMQELAKINKIISRELPEAKKELLLVLDATTGQNAMSQAKNFGENCGVTGIILTKLDSTAKGGIVIAIKTQQDIPVKYIGVGEKIDDFGPFSAKEFASALFD